MSIPDRAYGERMLRLPMGLPSHVASRLSSAPLAAIAEELTGLLSLPCFDQETVDAIDGWLEVYGVLS